jgi:hypothetical protein
VLGILLTRGKHLHDHIISLRVEVWTHTIGLTPSILIEVSVSLQESERSCIRVLGIWILPLSTILMFELEFFRQCGSFLFSILI